MNKWNTRDLRGHCATIREVAYSILDGVIRIIHWNNPFGYTTALGIDSASNRNVYQEYFLGGKGGRWVALTTLPPSCDNCLEIWESQTPGTLRVCPGLWGISLKHPLFTRFWEAKKKARLDKAPRLSVPPSALCCTISGIKLHFFRFSWNSEEKIFVKFLQEAWFPWKLAQR